MSRLYRLAQQEAIDGEYEHPRPRFEPVRTARASETDVREYARELADLRATRGKAAKAWAVRGLVGTAAMLLPTPLMPLAFLISVVCFVAAVACWATMPPPPAVVERRFALIRESEGRDADLRP